jgi:hypothetical protein
MPGERFVLSDQHVGEAIAVEMEGRGKPKGPLPAAES